MPWNITNQQLDPMTATLDGGGAAVALPPNVAVPVNAGVASLRYHDLTYVRVGAWVIAANVPLTAHYDGGNNCRLTTPQHFDVIYTHQLQDPHPHAKDEKKNK